MHVSVHMFTSACHKTHFKVFLGVAFEASGKTTAVMDHRDEKCDVDDDDDGMVVFIQTTEKIAESNHWPQSAKRAPL